MRSGLQRRCRPHLFTALLCIAAIALYAISNTFFSSFRSPTEEVDPAIASPYLSFSPQDHCQAGPLLPSGEKYMLYAPHSGFSNQVGELRNALLMAALLNRTLVLPPIFDHHAVVLGSCPKFRVQEPHELRALAWAHITELIRNGRYLAIADVLDLSAVAPLVKLVDLRIFAMLWCGVDIMSACSGSLCRSLAALTLNWGTLESCGAFLSRPDEVHGSCVYGVNEDCRTTIWVHDEGNMGSLQANDSSSTSKVAPLNFSNQRVTNSSVKAKYGQRSYKEVVETLGDGSETSKFEVLFFGSLFSSEYKGVQLHVDIESSTDLKIRMLVEAMKVMPFTSPVVSAGKLYSKERIRKPFLCAQLRLLDGQFKNHWERTFSSLKSQLKVAQEQQGMAKVLDVFVMTDLPRSSWNKSYLGELDEDTAYRLHTIDGNDPMVKETAMRLAMEDYGLRFGYLPLLNKTMFTEIQSSAIVTVHPDIILFVEEMICSCATLGFVGTSGSTLGANILRLRLGNICTTNHMQ